MEQINAFYEFMRKRSYIFIIAAAIESPRLIYSFSAFRENMLAGILLALLSTYALSLTFENYFSHRNRILLLVLGVISIVINLIIVTPVISFLLQNSTDEINLVKIFGANQYLINVYAATVTLSTFWPLILIGAVHGYGIIETLESPQIADLTLYNLLQNLEKKLNSIDSKVDAYSIEFEKRLETIVLEINQRIDSIETTSSKKEIKQNNQQNDDEDSVEEVKLNSEIINLLRTSPKTVEELATAAFVDLKILENGPRWGILRKLTKSGIIKKVGNLYELVEGN